MATQYTGWGCTHDAYIVPGSETNEGVTIRVVCYWQNSGWRYDISNVHAWVYCNGAAWQVLNNGKVNSSNIANTAALQLGYHDFYVAKNYGWQNISCYATIDSDSSYAGNYTRSSSASTVGFSAKPSYTISYNANGGTGAPGSHTKWYNETAYISTTRPSRNGHNFLGWSDSPSGQVWYNPGDAYGNNSGITLYAIWSPHTYTISFNANGGTGAPGNQTKVYGTVLKLSSTIPTRTNYNFLGWSTSASGGVVYTAGGDYGTDGNATLYAVWELAYIKPRINNFTANRCTSDGTLDDTGTYVKVTFDWATDRSVTAITIQAKTQSSTIWADEPVSASGTSGSISHLIGGGEASTDISYHVRAYVADGSGDEYTTYSSIVSIGTTKFPIDVKDGGTGVAIGKAAEEDDLLDVDMNSRFRKNVTIDGGLNINETYNGGNVPIACTAWGETLYDDVGVDQQLNKSGLYTINQEGWHHLINVRHRNGTSDGVNYGMQIRQNFDITYATEIRAQHAGTWSSWHQIYKAKTLFDNSSGVSGTIELNETSANFKKIIVQGKSVQVHGCCECNDPNGKVFNLVIDGEGSSGWYIPTSILLHFNGNTLTITLQKTLTINSSQQDYQLDNPWYAIKITKVIGYR